MRNGIHLKRASTCGERCVCEGKRCVHWQRLLALAPPSLHSAPAAPNAIQNCVDRPYFTVGFLAVSGKRINGNQHYVPMRRRKRLGCMVCERSPNERIRKRLELYVCVWLVKRAYQTDVPIMMACICGMCVRRCLQAAYT